MGILSNNKNYRIEIQALNDLRNTNDFSNKIEKLNLKAN
ncbi:hypothetical protein JGS6364_00331 [[Clostridium] sordellii]|nr:hypothetical protein H477_3894 [[Clostridium] sordellii ATCC 9714] [Paeniclostridium sordellii ATCC 9714]CEK29387.1 hypothetical protein JGS6364_00331 [[Clostridium] sordellii] [Paeniclostridium sordellii]